MNEENWDLQNVYSYDLMQNFHIKGIHIMRARNGDFLGTIFRKTASYYLLIFTFHRT